MFNKLSYKFSFSHQCSQDRNRAVYHRLIHISFHSPVFSFKLGTSQRKPWSDVDQMRSLRVAIIPCVESFNLVAYFVAIMQDPKSIVIEQCSSIVLPWNSKGKSSPSFSQFLNSVIPIQIGRSQHTILALTFCTLPIVFRIPFWIF